MTASQQKAQEALTFAISQTIELAHKLTTAQAQLRTLKRNEGGDMVVCPHDISFLKIAIDTAHKTCAAVRPSI